MFELLSSILPWELRETTYIFEALHGQAPDQLGKAVSS